MGSEPSEAFTAGDWKASFSGGQWGVTGELLSNGGRHRRICRTGSPRVYRDEVLDREDEANARLIAAAPDLLEALRKIARLASDGRRTASLPVIDRMACEAIAKALGPSAHDTTERQIRPREDDQ